MTSRFLFGLDRLFDRARGSNGTNGPRISRGRALDDICEGLRRVVEAGLGSAGRSKPRLARRVDLVKKAQAFVAGNLTADLTAEDLARSLGVSYRALNYAFKDSLGVSPYKYVLTEKLHAVRRQLKTSDISVTEACFAHGFSTPSRFARHYSRLFGELPSKTRATVLHLSP